MFFFILITTVLGLVLISWEEILSWSLVRAEGWSSLGQQSRLLNYPRCHLMRLKNDKILKEVYWSVERFKNDLWKLNIVPLELSFSPEVFAVAVMLWRLKCQGCIRDLVILETPAVVKWNVSWENVCSKRPNNLAWKWS